MMYPLLQRTIEKNRTCIRDILNHTVYITLLNIYSLLIRTIVDIDIKLHRCYIKSVKAVKLKTLYHGSFGKSGIQGDFFATK